MQAAQGCTKGKGVVKVLSIVYHNRAGKDPLNEYKFLVWFKRNGASSDCRALVPLVDNKFNSSKSELKMVEAGFFRKPVIVSNVWPYKYIINEKNCKTVDKPKDWFRHMKFFIKNKSAIREYGEALYESIKDKYDIRNVNKRRIEFYKEILK